MKSHFGLSFVALIALVHATYAQEANSVLVLEKTTPLPGVKGRIDHMALDASGERLWIAALQNCTVEVVDVKDGKSVATIKEIKEPQGICYSQELKRFFVASGQDGYVRAYDESTKLVAETSGFEDADNVRYDRKSKRVFVGYGKGKIGVLNASDLSMVGEVELQGHPESFQLEKGGTKLFVNVPTEKQIAVIDREKMAVTAKWPIEAAKSNFPMALDESTQRLFVGCRQPPRLVVIDLTSGKEIAKLECAGDLDDVFFDSNRRRIYASGGAGSISVFTQVDGDTYRLATTIETRKGCRTCCFDGVRARLHVAVPQMANRGAEIRTFRCEN